MRQLVTTTECRLFGLFTIFTFDEWEEVERRNMTKEDQHQEPIKKEEKTEEKKKEEPKKNDSVFPPVANEEKKEEPKKSAPKPTPVDPASSEINTLAGSDL